MYRCSYESEWWVYVKIYYIIFFFNLLFICIVVTWKSADLVKRTSIVKWIFLSKLFMWIQAGQIWTSMFPYSVLKIIAKPHDWIVLGFKKKTLSLLCCATYFFEMRVYTYICVWCCSYRKQALGDGLKCYAEVHRVLMKNRFVTMGVNSSL